jgi:uncharacterized integral membrane protein
MVRKIVSAVILVPLALIIIGFAVANRQAITVSFDPFDAVQPAYAASMPLFVLIFVLVIFGVILGGTAAWLRQARWRWAARRAEGENRELRLENDLLKRQLGETPPARLSPPLYPASPTTLRSPVE